jgi:hypothetical protein
VFRPEPRLGSPQPDEVILDHARRDLSQSLLAELFQEPLAVVFVELCGERRLVFAGIIQVDFVEELGEVLQVGILQERPRLDLSFQVILLLLAFLLEVIKGIPFFPLKVNW